MLYGDTSTFISLPLSFLSLEEQGAHRWNHFTNSCLANIHDDLLRAETGLDAVTAVFQFISS